LLPIHGFSQERVSGRSSEVLDGVLLLLFFPERQVLLEELNDGLGISEGLFVDIVNLLESIRQSLLTELTGRLVVVHNLVMEDGEVESETQSDWVASVQTLRSLGSELIVLESSVLNGLKVFARGAFSNISVVVSDHLVEEGFGLISGGNLHASALDGVYDSKTLIVQFLLNLLLVFGEGTVEL
jgi:hypothetical protein